LWIEDRESRDPFQRSDLIDDLNVLSRYYALPFLLGEFDHAADIAPLSSLIARTGWIAEPTARPAPMEGPSGYSGAVLHLAGDAGDTQTNHRDNLFSTVVDGYLELFFDWVLPVACVNGAIRDDALDQVKVAYATITGPPKTKITDNMKGWGGRAINALLEPFLQRRETTEALVSGSLRLRPDGDVIEKFWWRVHDIAVLLDKAGYADEAVHLRAQVRHHWGRVPAPEERTAERSDHGDRSRDIPFSERDLDYRAAQKGQHELEPPDEIARHDQVDDAISRFREGPLDQEEYQRAYAALTNTDSSSAHSTRTDSQGVQATGGDPGGTPAEEDPTEVKLGDVDPGVLKVALRCLIDSAEMGFIATQDVNWRSFVRTRLAQVGSTFPVDDVVKASVAIIMKALQRRRRAGPDVDDAGLDSGD